MTAWCLITTLATSVTGFMFDRPPTQKDPPFAVAQAVLLMVFVGLGIAALKKFRPMVPTAALA